MRTIQTTLGEQDQCLHERMTSITDAGKERFVCMLCYHVSDTRFGASATRGGVSTRQNQIDTK